MLSESDSRLYTNFEFCEEKNHKRFKSILIWKAKQLMLIKKNTKKSLHFLEDSSSGEQVGDIGQLSV